MTVSLSFFVVEDFRSNQLQQITLAALWLAASANKKWLRSHFSSACASVHGEKKPSDPNGAAAEARQSIVSNEKMSGSSQFGIVQQQGQFTPCVGSGLNTHVVSCCCALSPSLPPPLPLGLARCGFRSAKVLLCPQLGT